MKINSTISVLLLYLLLGINTVAMAQLGSISGKVSDDKGVLVGATIYLETNRSQGSNTDINGEFTLSNIAVGTQTIVVNYLGYESQTLSVEVKTGEVSSVNVKMVAGYVNGDVVVISTQRRGQTEAINQQLSSDKIASIVSSDRIQELPDVNAAEAIGRLPGVVLSRSGGEGQKVSIRGMEPKFSAITVNGVRLPSNSGTDRSVDLSLIAPELLDAIEVFKSPLPDMDAEAVGGTVNLRLRKAPEGFRLMTRGLWGYNDLAGQFRDYKGVVQTSSRFFNNKIGVIAQGSVERFNRSGDYLSNNWRQGPTDSLNNTQILGNALGLEDRTEIRKRYNASISLDYAINPKHSLSFFGVYSRTNRDQFRISEGYNPSGPSISYSGQGFENNLSLFSGTLSGNHNFNWLIADWSVANSASLGRTPYNYLIRFGDTQNDFDEDLNNDGHPRTFFAAATPDLIQSNLIGGESQDSQTFENTYTALVNFAIPFKLGKKLSAEFKFGGKYYQVDRTRDVSVLTEDFYYLGGTFTSNATNRFTEADGEVTTLPTNSNLIGINTFLSDGPSPLFVDENGVQQTLYANLDPTIIRNWYDSQKDILNNNRFALVDNYQVAESIVAAYAMFKIKYQDKLTIIPGFRYEYSDNSYQGGFSTVNGRYGVNGDFVDTTSYQQYGEFLPHLHIKYKPFDWLDVRASFSQTLARPDFNFVTPRTQLNNTSLNITAGNPNLRYAKSTNYDLHLSAYKGTLGLITIGGFYKDVSNMFFPFTVNLSDAETAAQYGWDEYQGYNLNTFVNLEDSRVFGYEIDIQTNLGFLPAPFNGIVINTNYTRLWSQTQAFFQTSETILVNPFPPIFETTYTTNVREVEMLSQVPHIFNLSLGYDIKKFSARISWIYQGTRASGYSLNKDFDRFASEFWRVDASIRQGIGEKWTAFFNINNITNQQDISFTRNPSYLNNIQTFGTTATVGLQFKIIPD
ncbi:MAG: TonB-dependent receptor [Bacteroidia bacterium]